VETAKQDRRTSWRDIVHIALVLVTIEGALWTEGRLQARWSEAAFVTLILCVVWSRPRIRELGVGWRGMAGASVAIPVAFLASSAVILLAWWAGTLKILYGNMPVSWHAIFYAIWALEQQFVLNSFFYVRFEGLMGDSTRTLILTALLFSLVHIPNPVLVPATFVGGLFFVYLFRRFRNIYPLALAHALLGLTLAISIPDHWLRHMRVGLGFFHFHPLG
jgi:membrane protease YdiL (CAAX protease family)